MKGVDAILASVLILLISITAIFLALQLGRPATQKSQEILLMQEGQNNLISIDNAVRSVLAEGEGSVRVLRFSVSGGEYEIDNSTNSVQFSMESESQIIAEGVSKTENGINFTNSEGTIYLNLTYADAQIVGEGNFGRGYQTLTVRNDGFNETTHKQMVYVSLNPVAPATLFTNHYNQTKTLVIEGTNTTSPLSLNDLGVNTYDILEGFEYGGQPNYSQQETANITGFNTTPADFTNSIDNQNYNVTSTAGQSGGPTMNRYNQTQTNIIFGSNSTSPDYLNIGDAQTYNVTEKGTTVSMLNTSSDLETGTQQKKVSSSQNWYNVVLNDVGDTYVSESSKTSNYGSAATFIVASRSLSRNARSFILWNLSVIPAGATVTNANMSLNMTTAPSSSRSYTAYNTSPSWTETTLNWNNQPPSGISQDTEPTGTTSRVKLYWNVTNAVTSSSGSNMSIVIRDSNENQSTTNYQGTFVSKEGASAQRPSLNITYYNYSILINQNTTNTTYGNVLSVPTEVITNISVTVNVSSYNKTGSSGRGSNPDLWLEVWNGTVWSAVGNFSVTGNGNFIKYIPVQDNIYTWWTNNPTQRNMVIKGRYFDANATAWDEINYTDVWVRIDSNKTTYRAEIEHNTSGVNFQGALGSINVSVNFSTNVTSSLNLIVYNFNSGVWNYTACQSGTATANLWYNWWCNITVNPSSYNSSDGKISIRLNGTDHPSHALIREDYIQYYVGYTAAPAYANISIEQNSSPISESSSDIAKINVTTLLKTNMSSGIPFVLYIYNFSSDLWERCSQASINTTYSKMECVKTKSSDYMSPDGKIRIRINSSGDANTHQVMEDYLAYQITKQNQYRMEVESNATRISLSGILYGISVSLNFSTNNTNSPAFEISIYNFSSNGWESCDSSSPSANIWYTRWCNVTLTPADYLSGGVIRVRLNETSHQTFSEVKEDYIQYYVIYTQ